MYITNYFMAKEALLIIDVQNDFCPKGSLAVTNGDEVVVPINAAIKHAKENNMPVLFSRDWHPKKTKHFEKWPPHCVQNTKGAEFHPDLNTEEGIVFSKGMGAEEDSYTAFDGVNEKGQRLEEYLREAQTLQLFVAGLATDYCVRASALDALAKGFNTVILSDAIKAVNIKPDDGKKALNEMTSAGVRTMTTKTLISRKS